MALYHLSAKVISRAQGRSAVAAAAYRSGDSLASDRDGRVHDYSRKGGVMHAEILAPSDAPDWMRDRGQLWNAVEAAEKRKDAQLAREFEIGIPRELTPDQGLAAVRGFVAGELVARGMVADIAVHDTQAKDGGRQPHAHVMVTMRNLTGDGFGKKNRDWNDAGQLESWRASWATHANQALERAGRPERVDHRSLTVQRQEASLAAEQAREQGDHPAADAFEERAIQLDRAPQPKIGVTATAMERRGEKTERGELAREVEAANDNRRSLARYLADIGRQLRELREGVSQGLREAKASIAARLDALRGRFAGADGKSGVEKSADVPAAAGKAKDRAGDGRADGIEARLRALRERPVSPPPSPARTQERSQEPPAARSPDRAADRPAAAPERARPVAPVRRKERDWGHER